MARPGTDERRWDYASERTLQYRALLALPRFEFGSFVERALQALPFKLGESKAEIAIPYAFDDTFVQATEQAIDDLVFLLWRRREGDSPGEVRTDDRKLVPPGYVSSAFVDGSLDLAAAQRAVRFDPSLDSGILEAWLPHGHGRPLLEQLAALFSLAAEADARAAGSTPYFLLSLVGFADLVEPRKSRGKQLVSRLHPYEKVEKALGFALFALVQAAAERALTSLPARAGFDAQGYMTRMRAALTPLTFCSIRGRALQNDLNPWALPQSLAEDLDRTWVSLLAEDPDPGATSRRLKAALTEDESLRARAAQTAAVLHFRRCALDWLALYGGIDAELTDALLPVATNDQSAFSALSNSKRVATALARFSRGRRADAAGEAVTLALGEALRRGGERPDGIGEVAAAFTCLALDRVVNNALDAGRKCLRDRRADRSREQLQSEYLAGRLYRLSSDGKEFRRPLARAAEGHLFIDLKNFTQRTYRAKELVMAEFLRAEFYQPMLNAAAELAVRSGGERSLVLQNLLGDAAVFSGEMPALLEVARAIQRICRSYAEALKHRIGTTEREIAARKAEVESRLNKQLDALREQAQTIEAELNRKAALPEEQRERMLWQEIEGRLAQLDVRAQAARARQDEAESARAQEAAHALQTQMRNVFGKIENLFGKARDDYVTELLLSADRARLHAVERKAAEARNAGMCELRALEEELRAQRGYGLEAGLFITYGATAEVVRISDEVFGEVRVAVAEKINEAARGTARNGFLSAKLQALVSRARAERGNPNLEYPFRVYADSAYNLLLPADLNDQIDACIRERDPAKARKTAKLAAERLLTDLARAMGMGDNQPPEVLNTLSDIYNTGEALSAEALSAFLASTANTHEWFRRVVPVRELDPEFHSLFAMLCEELELVICVPRGIDASGAVVFRRAGQVQFRGFEGKSPTIVWELLRPDSAFYLLLAQKHLSLWAVEAQGQSGAKELPS